MSTERVLTILGFYVIQQDEIGVKLSFGKYSDIVLPGLGFAIPLVEQVLKTKRSLQTIDLPEQQIVLNGNISVRISGNLNFRVERPEKALLEVSNYRYTIQQLALTTIADVLGTKTIEEVRQAKIKIAEEIEQIIAKNANEWGLRDVDIRLTDAQMDPGLQRAMMRETEAQKEAAAIQIKAAADQEVAQIFAQAAQTLARAPGAMTLRILQTLNDLSHDKSTVVIPLPMDFLAQRPARQESPTEPAPEMIGREAPETSETALPADSLYPVAELKLVKGETVTRCPSCSTRYRISRIWGNPLRDLDPDHPGQQICCKKCATIFTLPQELSKESAPAEMEL